MILLHQHWVSPAFICKVIKGEPKILEPHKCDEIGWYSPEEIKKMDLSIVSRFNFKNYILKSDFPELKKFLNKRVLDIH